MEIKKTNKNQKFFTLSPGKITEKYHPFIHPFSATYPGSGCKGSRLIYAYMSRPHSALAKPTNQQM